MRLNYYNDQTLLTTIKQKCSEQLEIRILLFLIFFSFLLLYVRNIFILSETKFKVIIYLAYLVWQCNFQNVI